MIQKNSLWPSVAWWSPEVDVKLSDQIKLWDVVTGQQIATLERHAEGVNSVPFSPDDKTLTSGAEDGTVKSRDISE